MLGEFACPICKSVKNGLMPTSDTVAAQSMSSQKQMFLVDFLSCVLMKQQGVVDKTQIESTEFFLTENILSRDIRDDPFKFVKLLANFIIHNVALVDVHGLGKFVTTCD